MDSCTIIIPFVKEFEFLEGVIRQIYKCSHPEIEYEVLLIDQSGSPEVYKTISQHAFFSLYPCPQIDAGYPIDVGLQFAKGEYVCTLDADAFPIKDTWLYEPIQLIKKHNLSFVGKQTGLHLFPAYKEKSNFYHINNYYRVSRTDLAKEVSKQVGFMRPQNRHKAMFNPKLKYEYNLECDNGVVAQMYSDDKELGDKFSYPIKSVLGFTHEVGVYGMVIDDKVFHMVFGFCEEYGLDKAKALGKEYIAISEMIKERGLTDEVIESLLANQKPHMDGYHYWNCKTKTERTLSEEEYKALL